MCMFLFVKRLILYMRAYFIHFMSSLWNVLLTKRILRQTSFTISIDSVHGVLCDLNVSFETTPFILIA